MSYCIFFSGIRYLTILYWKVDICEPHRSKAGHLVRIAICVCKLALKISKRKKIALAQKHGMITVEGALVTFKSSPYVSSFFANMLFLGRCFSGFYDLIASLLNYLLSRNKCFV